MSDWTTVAWWLCAGLAGWWLTGTVITLALCRAIGQLRRSVSDEDEE